MYWKTCITRISTRFLMLAVWNSYFQDQELRARLPSSHMSIWRSPNSWGWLTNLVRHLTTTTLPRGWLTILVRQLPTLNLWWILPPPLRVIDQPSETPNHHWPCQGWLIILVRHLPTSNPGGSFPHPWGSLANLVGYLSTPDLARGND